MRDVTWSRRGGAVEYLIGRALDADAVAVGWISYLECVEGVCTAVRAVPSPESRA
jgi:hypothetical protein